MADAAVATPAAPNIAAGSPGASGTPSMGSTPSAPSGDPGTGSNGQGGPSGEGAAPKSGPLKFEIDGKSYDVELDDQSLEDEGDGAQEFKFEQLDAIKESHADLHKALKKRLSEHSRFAAKFKSPEELDAHLERVEAISGGKGLDALEQAVGGMASDLQKLRSGDPGEWAKDAPEEYSAAAQKFSDEWLKADPKAAVSYLAKAAVQAFLAKDAYGQSMLDAFNAAFDATTDPQTRKLLERVAHTFDAIVQNSKYEPDSTALRSRQLDQREKQVLMRDVDQRTAPRIADANSKALKDALASKFPEMKVAPDERRSWLKDMERHFLDAAKASPRFMREMAAAIKSKDLDEVQSITDEYRGEFSAEAVKRLYRARLSKLKENIRKDASSKTEAGGGGSSQPAGTVKWSGKTDPRTGAPDADYDYARMRAEGIDAVDGVFFVKGKREKYSW